MQDHLVETYITVHDQDIILRCEASGQFASLPSYVYGFVGNRPIDLLPPEVLAKTIICRDYLPNFEQYPQFYDFTFWYVLAKHNLIKSKYIICLQYDHFTVEEGGYVLLLDRLSTNPGMVAMVPAGYEQTNWMLQVPNFHHNFHAALRSVGVTEDMSQLTTPVWPTTQGTAWRASYFTLFMLWFEPVFETLQNELFAGHIAERLLTVYTLRTHAPQYVTGLFEHRSADCHGTGDWMRGDMASFSAKNSAFTQTYVSPS